ncbi:NAD(P)/FAD-dependent oxidoreductase [Kineococcus gynurae]|uniref:NAD(P)/FAD-dependent oxidoreductase n=1 Tax=Kineococcus gynurae TaxID=452979 RepID=A0ABV5LXL4_9ACTN
MGTDWDAIVVGGGAAGLAAALMLGRSRRRILVLDAGEPRNRFAAHMQAVLGHDGVPPEQLLARGREEVRRYGVQVEEAVVHGVAEDATGLAVETDGAALRTRALVVATGVRDTLPPVPGLAEHWGRSVLHCPYCHGWEVRDRDLGVLVQSPMGAHQAQLVRQLSDSVTVFTGVAGTPADVLGPAAERLRSRGVRIVPEPVLDVVGSDSALQAVRTADGTEHPVQALFVAAALQPLDGFLSGLDLARADTPVGRFLAVDPMQRTSSPRIWAAGNVAAPMANVPLATAAGTMAGAAVNAALTEEDFDRAAWAAGTPS